MAREPGAATAPETGVSPTVRFRCMACRAEQNTLAADFRCTVCGELLEITHSARDLDSSRTKSLWRQRKLSLDPLDLSGVWRFRELLPILADFAAAVTLREGNTPIYDLPGCAKSAGLQQLFAKHQGMNPTGSFKDTGMTAAISVAAERGFKWVGCASTGNTAASVAAYACRAGLQSVVLLPEGQVAWGKLAQALEYGALTCQLRTDFDGCMQVLNEVVRRAPVYLLNSVNPYRIEGQKTAAAETLEQLDWRVPDHVIVPGGNLAHGSALGRGFLELRELGFIASVPRVSFIQAEGANALVRTMREADGAHLVSVKAATLATAIRIGSPASWRNAVAVLRTTGGFCEEVSEQQLAVAKAEIGAEGIGCEPASAATLAGLKKLTAAGKISRGDHVVIVLTGHVLKDPEYTIRFHRGELLPDLAPEAPAEGRRLARPPVVLEPDADAVIRLLDKAGNA